MNDRVYQVRVLGLDVADVLDVHFGALKDLEVTVLVNGKPIVNGRAEIKLVDHGIEYAVRAETEAQRWLRDARVKAGEP